MQKQLFFLIILSLIWYLRRYLYFINRSTCTKIRKVTVWVRWGQRAGAMMMDQFFLLNTTVHTLNWQRFIGHLILITGVFLIKNY